MSKKTAPMCSKCPTTVCSPQIKQDEKLPLDKAPAFCPMVNMTDVMNKALAKYEEPSTKEFARQASIQEFECYEETPTGIYPRNPRIVELIGFSKKMNYKKLGLAFCAGLTNEARLLTTLLETHGFEVVSVRCKAGAVSKDKIGIKPEQKISHGKRWESMCNPIAQAEIMNAQKVDFAVVLGLCLGHDTLFIQHCKVPITVLAVKDRVTGHNPLVPLYTIDTFYKSIKNPA